MAETNFNQGMRLRSQLVIAAESFAREENLSIVLIPTKSKDLDEQPKLAQKVVDAVDQANKKICVTVLRYIVDKLESSYVQVRLFPRKKEDEKFQQTVYMKNKLEEFIYHLDVMNSVCHKVITYQPIGNVLQKLISFAYSLIFFSIRVRMS